MEKSYHIRNRQQERTQSLCTPHPPVHRNQSHDFMNCTRIIVVIDPATSHFKKHTLSTNAQATNDQSKLFDRSQPLHWIANQSMKLDTMSRIRKHWRSKKQGNIDTKQPEI